MAERSAIEWTGGTWNVVTGCTKVSPGCAHCYIERTVPFRMQGRRFERVGNEETTGVLLHPERLDPKHALYPTRLADPIFVCSLADLFHEEVPDEFIYEVWAVMADVPDRTFQVLTKRPERARELLATEQAPFRVAQALDRLRVRREIAKLEEEIRPVAGFPGYFVSNLGVVYSERRGERRHLSPDVGAQGHMRVQLYRGDGDRGERRLVHHIVLEAFVRPRSGTDDQGCHRDGDPTNNVLSNLSWGSQATNWDDRRRQGNHRSYAKLDAGHVRWIRERFARGDSASELARAYGVSDTQIRNIVAGRQWAVETPIPWPLPGVWLGVSIENARYTWRADVLREIPAAVRFISAEPLLGSLFPSVSANSQPRVNRTLGGALGEPGYSKRPLDLTGIDWVIAGGESGGPKTRPMHPDWAREIRDACLGACEGCAERERRRIATGATLSGHACSGRPAFFFKQYGSWSPAGIGDITTTRIHLGLTRDGRTVSPGEAADTPGAEFMVYRGAQPKSGGRHLDGRIWHELPQPKAAAS